MEKIFSEKNIVNKEYYEGIKSLVNCLICLGLVENPVQCTKCQHYFCSECIKVNKTCPLRCEDNQFIKSITCSNLLSNIKFKCACEEIVPYDDREKHLDKCNKKDYQSYYEYYKEKYENLKNQLNENYKIKSHYFIKVSVHNHPVEIIRRYINSWFCNVCKQYFDTNIPSYHCTLCDFDICIKCAKSYVKEGNVKQIDDD